MLRHFASVIWQTTSALGRARDGSLFVVDPCYFPAEVETVAVAWREAGGGGYVVLTHGEVARRERT